MLRVATFGRCDPRYGGPDEDWGRDDEGNADCA